MKLQQKKQDNEHDLLVMPEKKKAYDEADDKADFNADYEVTERGGRRRGKTERGRERDRARERERVMRSQNTWEESEREAVKE